MEVGSDNEVKGEAKNVLNEDENMAENKDVRSQDE